MRPDIVVRSKTFVLEYVMVSDEPCTWDSTRRILRLLSLYNDPLQPKLFGIYFLAHFCVLYSERYIAHNSP